MNNAPHAETPPPMAAMFDARPFTREDRQALFGVLALAIVFYGFLSARMACISRDGVFFIEFAKELADDPMRWLGIHTKQPGYSFLLLGVHRVLGPLLGGDTPLGWQRCGQLIACLGGVASCGLIFLMARRLFDTTIAFMAGLLAVCWPASGQLSADVLSDMPHLALYLAALLMAHRAMQRQCARRMVACGVFAGLAYLMRQEALGIVAASAIGWMWPGQVRKRKEKLIGIAALGLCFAAVVAPHSIASGRLMPSKSLNEMIFGSEDDAQTASSLGRALLREQWHPEDVLAVEPSSVGRASSLTPLRAEAIPWHKAPARIAEAWAKSGRYVISTLFLLCLFLKSAHRADKTGRRLVLLAVALQVIAVQLRVKSYGEISSRYVVIPLALSIPWAGAGLLAALTIIATKLRSRWPLLRPVDIRNVGLVIVMLPMVYYLTLPPGGDRADYRTAGQWLYDNADPGDVVIAHERLKQVLFYAGRTYPNRDKWAVCDQTDGRRELVRLLLKKNARWLVDIEQSRRAQIDEAAHFAALQSGEVGGLTLVQSFGRAHVYKIVSE